MCSECWRRWAIHMDRLRKHLLYLSTGEFAALCTFGFLCRSLRLGPTSLAAFSYLMFVLLQGSIYWGYRYVLLRKRQSPGCKAATFWRVQRFLSTGLMALVGLMIPIAHKGLWDLFWGIAAFAFAFIEYINYFWYRLSYGKSGFNINVLLNTKLEKSSMNKLMTKNKNYGPSRGEKDQ